MGQFHSGRSVVETKTVVCLDAALTTVEDKE